MKNVSYFDQWPRERYAGHEFYRIPMKEWRAHMREIGLARFTDEPDAEDGFYLHPYFPPDDKLEFPGSPELVDCGLFVESGIARHSVWARVQKGDKTVMLPRPANEKGFTATQIDSIFPTDDWYGECFQVLENHGWTQSGRLSFDLLRRVEEAEGVDFVAAAKERFGDNWEARVLELASARFTEPLSRLWYAANLQALYYCHEDDVRLGYLWCEYRMKMRFEVLVLKQIEVTEKNRSNAKKGGRGPEKRERYSTLKRLVYPQRVSVLVAKDKEALRIVRQIAAAHDKTADEKLFHVAGGSKLLSPGWFDEWLDEFRREVL